MDDKELAVLVQELGGAAAGQSLLLRSRLGREFAMLQGPTTDQLEGLHFSPDGSQLVAEITGTGSPQV